MMPPDHGRMMPPDHGSGLAMQITVWILLWLWRAAFTMRDWPELDKTKKSLTLFLLALDFFRKKSDSPPPIHCRQPVAAHKIVQEPPPPTPTIKLGHHTTTRACCGAWFHSPQWSTATSIKAVKILALILPSSNGHCCCSDYNLGDG